MIPGRRLVCCAGFPPAADDASLAAALRVRAAGTPVDLIHQRPDLVSNSDADTVELIAPWIRRFDPIDLPTPLDSWRSISAFADRGFDVMARWERADGPYDSLYSHAPHASSHLLAARIRHRRPEIHWEAEFSDARWWLGGSDGRDPGSAGGRLIGELGAAIERAGFPRPRRLDIDDWCTAATFALADSLVFTSEPLRSAVLEACHDDRLAARAEAISAVSPLPPLDRDLYGVGTPPTELSDARFHIAYVGPFTRNRVIADVVAAMGTLPPTMRRLVTLHLFCPDPAGAVKAANVAKLDDCIDVNPIPSLFELLALFDHMDLLLVHDELPVSGAHSRALQATWSQHRGARAPVWGITAEGSLLAGQPLDLRSPIDHVSAIAATLTAAIQAWRDRRTASSG